MQTVYEGKTILEWIDLVRSGDVVERCAAALALAEFKPNEPPARAALVSTLRDPEPPVQAAAQAALGLVLNLTDEHRRKMLAVLLGPDGEMQRMLLQSLCELIGPDALSAVPQFETMPTSSEQFVGDTGATTLPNSKQPPVPEPIAPVSELPDFTLVHVMPWWFLLGATAFCVLLAWILRGFWWHKWTMLAMAAIAAFVVLYSWSRKGNDSHSVKRFRSRARIGGSAIFAAACGALISIFFPLGTIFIDNESGVNVRLLINDEEWTSIGTGESKQKGLTRGTYRLTIQSMEGNHVFDAYDIDISSYEKYVLNVLSGQIYFHGTVQYGIAGGESKAITAKWLKLPEVDYLFRDPRKAIVTVNPVNKTFFLKGLGPQ